MRVVRHAELPQEHADHVLVEEMEEMEVLVEEVEEEEEKVVAVVWWYLGGGLTGDVEGALGARGEVEGGEGAVVEGGGGRVGDQGVGGGRPQPADHVDGPAGRGGDQADDQLDDQCSDELTMMDDGPPPGEVHVHPDVARVQAARSVPHAALGVRGGGGGGGLGTEGECGWWRRWR